MSGFVDYLRLILGLSSSSTKNPMVDNVVIYGQLSNAVVIGGQTSRMVVMAGQTSNHAVIVGD